MDCMCKACKFSKVNNITNMGWLARQASVGKNPKLQFYKLWKNTLSLKSCIIIYLNQRPFVFVHKGEAIISQIWNVLLPHSPLLCLVNHYLTLKYKYVSLPWKHLLNSPKLVIKTHMWVCCNVLGKPPLYLCIDYFHVCFLYSVSLLRTVTLVYFYIQHNAWYITGTQ